MSYNDVYEITFESFEQETAFINFLDSYNLTRKYYPFLPETMDEMIDRSRSALGIYIEKKALFIPEQVINEKINIIKRYLNDYIQITENLIIIDRYMFPNKYDDDYIINLVDILASCKADKILFITSNNYNQILFSNVKSKLGKLNKNCCLIISEEFHDRFWFSPKRGGFYMGTSLNGIGKRISSINKIPPYDFSQLIAHTKELWSKELHE